MSVTLLISLSLLFIVIVLVIYQTYLYLKTREEESTQNDILSNFLPFTKSDDVSKEYSLI